MPSLPRNNTWHSGKMTKSKFRSEALRNKYGVTLSYRPGTHFICFSEAERLAVIFSAALTFSLVLSLVARQEKVHSSSGRIPIGR